MQGTALPARGAGHGRASSRFAGVGMALLALGGCTPAAKPIVKPPSAAIANATATLVSMPLERFVDGVVEPIEAATLSAQTSGRVVQINADVDDFVPAGALLVRLRGTEQRAGMEQARAAVAAARARSQDASTSYERVAALYRARVLPKADFDRALSGRDAAAAQLSAAEAALVEANAGVTYTEIRAPYSMVVTRRMVELGELVTAGAAVLQGLSPQHLRVDVEVPQSDVDAVRRVRQAAVYIGGQRIAVAHVTVFPQAAPLSSTFHARLELPADITRALKGIYLDPGMYVKVGLVLGTTQRLLIPASALVRRSEVTAAYVLDEDGGWSLRYLRIGRRFAGGPARGASVEVLAGLSAGEHVAIDASEAARAASGD